MWDVYYIHELVDGESDLLRIEGVLSLLNTDGTYTLQDWVETPYEYLTAFNESRELLLTTYGYFTVDQTIEPEIGEDAVYLEIEADYDMILGGAEAVLVSNWSAVNTDFEVDLSIHSISLWWEAIDNGDDSCVWTFVFYVNNESMEYEGECQSDGAELTRETFLIEEITTLQVGDTFEVEIWYEGSEDINFYFNSEEFDTGVEVYFSMPE